MKWEIHPAKAAFQTFASDWDRLNATYYDSHPLYDSRFVGPLLDHFAKGNETLCIYRDQGTVTSALILTPDGIGRWSSFRPSQSQATAVLLQDVSLIRSLLDALPGFAWTIEFLAIDPRYSPDFTQLDLIKIVSPNAQTIGVSPSLSFAEYWELRPKNLKANTRRYFNRLEKEGATPTLTVLEIVEDMPAGVMRFGELESAGWKGAAGTAVSASNPQGEFYSEVLARFAQTSQAKVYELWLNDQLAASRLVVASERMLVILKTTYNENLARFAPGRNLLYRIIEEQLENHTSKTVEFYTNATRDQAEWSTFGCTIQNIQVFGNDFSTKAFPLLKLFQRALRGAKHRRDGTSLVPKVYAKAADSVAAIAVDPYKFEEFAPRESIENSIDWFDLLHRQVFPDDRGVRFYFVGDIDVPTTILPVRLTKSGRIKTVESLSNFYTSLYAPLQSGDSDLAVLREILATATRDHGGAHVMRFQPMDPESQGYKFLLDELEAIGWIPFKYFCFGNWFLRVTEGWDAYLKKRGANLRSKIKRMSKRFAAAGGTLEIVTTPEAVEPAITAFQEVYMASWKVPEPYPDFVPSLIRRLAPLGMLRLGIARLQDRPIAAQLWIVGEDKASIYKVAYHEDFASYSSGTVLTAHLMQHVIEEDHVREVDFLIGDDEYKKIWMSDRRERWGIIAFNPRTLIGFALFVKEVLARATRSVRGMIKSRFGEAKAHFPPSKPHR